MSPHNSDVTETIGALEFGDRANKVKLRALVNTAEVDAADFGVTDVSLDDALTSRILELKLALQAPPPTRQIYQLKVNC